MNIFSPFSDEAKRIAINLAQRHDAYMEILRREDALPSSMFFVTKGTQDYLVIKRHSRDNGTTIGARSADTEAALTTFTLERDAVQKSRQATEASLMEFIRQYKALKLPRAMPKPARILRELDIANLLGRDLMVVGTNTFAAYQLEAGCRFEGLADETEDFDLAWCRRAGVTHAAVQETSRNATLLSVLQRLDRQTRINRKKPCQALDSDGYEIELLVAPSLYSTLDKTEAFSPLASLHEQEWLLNGTPIRQVVVSRDDKTCPIFAPDPRWMALYKLWLADKPERNPNKRDKDRAQGTVLLDVVREYMQVSYPLDTDFVLDLPDELLPYFNGWAARVGYVPSSNAKRSFR